MNQQINLYLAEFKVKKDALTALLMAQVLGGIVGMMLLVSAYDVITRWQLNGELSELRSTLAEETRKTDELDEILARRSQNTELSDRLERAETLLESSQSIRDFLSESKLGNVGGFSEHFKDLSRASIEGLSISEFSISNGGDTAQLSGQVINSAMVPEFVANIQDGNSLLNAKNFSHAISRAGDEGQIFNFQLSTSQ